MYIWKREYAPFRVGGQLRRAIKTTVEGHSIVDLGRGFKGIYISGEGVFELESGGLVGNTITDVMQDIELCNDVGFMKKQIEIAKAECEKASEVSNKIFFAK